MAENQKQGQKHLIDCSCILPQFRNRREPVFHKFPVFSIIDEDDKVIEKYSQCINCGIIHRVYDICHSEILFGKEKLVSLIEIKDIKLSLPKDLSDLLASYNVDLPTWEEAQFLLENKIWGKPIILVSESEDDKKAGKLLKIMAENSFRVESFLYRVEV